MFTGLFSFHRAFGQSYSGKKSPPQLQILSWSEPYSILLALFDMPNSNRFGIFYRYRYFLKSPYRYQYRYFPKSPYQYRYRYRYFPKSPYRYRYRYRYIPDQPYRYRYRYRYFPGSLIDIDIDIDIFRTALSISIFSKFADISTIDINIRYFLHKSGEKTPK